MKRMDLEQWRAREVARLLALVEAERRYYQEIVAAMPAGLAILDSRLGFLSANRAFRRIFGLTESALAKAKLNDLFPGGEIASLVEETLSSGQPQVNLSVHYVSEEGPKPLRVSLQPFRGWDDDAEIEVLLAVYDLESPATGAVETGAPSKWAALENIDAIVWEREPETLRFIHVAGRAEEILGYPASEWTADPEFYSERLHAADRDWVTAFYRASLSSSDSRTCEYRARTADGRTVWLRDVIRVVRDSAGSPVKLSGITVNIDAEKLRDEQLIQAEKMAALARLAAKVTHDCNNLLMILTGYSEELRETIPPDHPSRADIEEILNATGRLAQLTGELLHFTRRPSLSPQVFSLNALLESYEAGIRRLLGPRIEVEFRLAPDLGYVNADWDQLGDAILTLAREAQQAMPEGGRWVAETANLELADAGPSSGEILPPGRYVTLSLSDTGPALDEETRSRLFEPFFSSVRSGQDLTAVYTLIRNSGGDIRVACGAETGTRYTIYLPCVEPRPAATGQTAAPTQEASAAPSRLETILVAEDEPGIRALLRKILQKQGYTVIEAADGREAAEALRNYEGDVRLLITDVVMPGLTGGELAREALKDFPELKVLFISGFSGEDLLAYGPFPSGAEILEKPFSLAALVEKVRSLISQR